jgi:hypothetical protein
MQISMPKVTMEFNLPEETEEFKDAQEGSALLGAIQEFDNQLRGIVKYGGEPEYTEAQIEIYDKVRDMLREHLNSAGLSVWR